MEHIELFIARYTKEFDFYERAAAMVANLLENDLRAAGVRCIVTSRAKNPSRLEVKCKQRHREHAYASVDDIYADIVDLAGVRVALYFPAEMKQVEAAVARLFEQVSAPKRFPAASQLRPGKRFSGYSAAHYRVRLREAETSEADRRYSAAKVEIQIASVLMHAWAEVEHDLVYMPLEGELSEEEYAILDQLNGLVMAGEIALERLQRAGELRVVEGQQIANHYDLAVHLLGRAKGFPEQAERDLGLGRVDLLFEFIHRLGIDTPQALGPYLEGLHGNVEVRPFSEQVIDALLADDASRYDLYRELRAETWAASPDHRDSSAEQSYVEVGRFLTEWAELEALIRQIAVQRGQARPAIPTPREIEKLNLFDAESRQEFHWLRQMRNHLVHGIEAPGPQELRHAAQRVRRLSELLKSEDNSLPGAAS